MTWWRWLLLYYGVGLIVASYCEPGGLDFVSYIAAMVWPIPVAKAVYYKAKMRFTR